MQTHCPEEDEEDDELFVNRGRRPYRLQELDLVRWRKDLSKTEKHWRKYINK